MIIAVHCSHGVDTILSKIVHQLYQEEKKKVDAEKEHKKQELEKKQQEERERQIAEEKRKMEEAIELAKFITPIQKAAAEMAKAPEGMF